MPSLLVGSEGRRPHRVAVFDNDGTLWSEQPMYFQLAFAFDRVKALAPNHPEWKTTQPFKGVRPLPFGVCVMDDETEAGSAARIVADMKKDWNAIYPL